MIGLPPRQLLKLPVVLGLTVGIGLFRLNIALLDVLVGVERLGLLGLDADLRLLGLLLFGLGLVPDLGAFPKAVLPVIMPLGLWSAGELR